MSTHSPEMDHPWRLLQSGKGAEAVSLLKERFLSNPTPGSSLSLGVAFLWTEQYDAAHEHFQASLDNANQLRMGSENDYAFLGAAEWSMGNYEAATKHWQAGETAPYAVLGVCIQTPMLLFAASILRPELPLHADTILAELREKLTDPRTRIWPGTLARFLAGMTTIEAVPSSWIGTREQIEIGTFFSCKWKTDFYKQLKDLHEGRTTLQQCKAGMAQFTDPDSFTKWDEDSLIQLLRTPEFYIARHQSR